MALDARKFDVSENYNHNRTNGNKQHMRENLTARIFLMDLDARKFSCAKISTLTVPTCLEQIQFRLGQANLKAYLPNWAGKDSVTIIYLVYTFVKT